MIKRVALFKLERTTLPSRLRQLTIPEEDEAEASGRMAVWCGVGCWLFGVGWAAGHTGMDYQIQI